MVQFNPTNPLEYLNLCGDFLVSDQPGDLALAREAVGAICRERVHLNPQFVSPIFNRALEEMLKSPHTERRIVARYISYGSNATEELFPYAVKESAGKINDKRYYPELNEFHAAGFDETQARKTAYIASIPIVFRENYGQNDRMVRYVTEGLRDQTFGATQEESQAKAPSRVAVVFGANRFRSIEKSKNRAFKDYVRTLRRDPNIQSSTIGFLWEPIWTAGCHEVPLTSVRTYYHLLKRLDPACAEACRTRLEQPQGGINDRVPYQEIREITKNGEPTLRTVDLFRSLEPIRKIYLAIMDPDFIALRNDGAGLFTHYNRLIKSHLRTHGIAPAVASTGYCAAQTVPSILRYGVLLDMRAREALSRVYPLAVYFPEPNLIVSVPEDARTVPESFINRDVVNQESRQIIADVMRTRRIEPIRALAFGSRGAVTTQMPDRFITDTNNENFSREKLGQQKILKALGGIRQSLVKSVWGWGMSMEQVISARGAEARGKTIKIYNLFNPLRLCIDKVFNPLFKYSIRHHFDTTMRFYEGYADVMGRIADIVCKSYRANYQTMLDLRADNIDGRGVLANPYFLRRVDVQEQMRRAGELVPIDRVQEIFQVQIGHLMEAHNGLIDMQLPPDDFAGVVRASRVIGHRIYETLADIRAGHV